jgi:beta-glucosidase/6-phospho-beta-glucosidase/beta-galactosidase
MTTIPKAEVRYEAESLEDIAQQLETYATQADARAKASMHSATINGQVGQAAAFRTAASIVRSTTIVKKFEHDEDLLNDLVRDGHDRFGQITGEGVKDIAKTYAMQMLRKTVS